jgi:phage-related tail fiber protein
MTGLLVLSGDPVNVLGAATKQYVDNAVAGLSWKEAVRVATTANITLSGTQTIDGVAVVAGDRVLVKNQTTGSQNGIYIVATGAWGRATDATTSTQVAGMAVYVDQGTTLASTGWTENVSGVITVGTTNITFSQFTGANTYTAGTGLTLSGNAFSITNTAVTAGSGYNTFTVNAQGQVTAASTTAYLTGNQNITFTGDATGSGTTSVVLTLANSGVVAGTYNTGGANHYPITVNSKGLVTAIGTAVALTVPFSQVTATPTTTTGYGITNAMIVGQVIDGGTF